MKKTSLVVLLFGILLSLSLYAYTTSKPPKTTYKTHIIAGEVISQNEVALRIKKEAASRESEGYRLVDISMTSIPFGQNGDYRIAYVATFELPSE